MKKFTVIEDTEVVLNGKKYLLEAGDKITIKSESGDYLNIFDNLNMVLEAFKKIEGQEWFDESFNDNEEMGLGYAIKFRRENPTIGDPVIYGRGGGHRYFIRPGGRVDFSEYHASEDQTKKAKELGFYIY